ncbi:STY4528 family pathogenicity island replication protein [Ralstonia pseudosolanacearum]|uniref:STY4528 family pathogenicity island replication protein n=1 Tax=Ralstonia pseudosolanacearum TaxID=1310165 RepID=UPI004053EA3F
MSVGRSDASGGATSSRPGDGFLFSGNRHETVPRALFFDRRLTPLERNAWQIIRLQLQDEGISTFPTYEQLAPLLASLPCVERASSETVARALTMLRLTRWLSLVQRRRDPNTGRILGNLYVLHDTPLTPFEAIQLDAEYLDLISRSLTHASKAVQRVGYQALSEVVDDPFLASGVLPARLKTIAQQLAPQGWRFDPPPRATDDAGESYPQHESEDGTPPRLRIHDPPPSDSEAGAKPLSDALLRNPNADRTVRKDLSSERHTYVPRTREGLRLPARFATLQAEQQSGALAALQQVDAPLRQAVLDEWAARCDARAIRNPAGYLFGIISKALRHEFNASRATAPASAPKPPTSTPSRPAPAPEVAHAHLAHLRKLLGILPEPEG